MFYYALCKNMMAWQVQRNSVVGISPNELDRNCIVPPKLGLCYKRLLYFLMFPQYPRSFFSPPLRNNMHQIMHLLTPVALIIDYHTAVSGVDPSLTLDTCETS